MPTRAKPLLFDLGFMALGRAMYSNPGRQLEGDAAGAARPLKTQMILGFNRNFKRTPGIVGNRGIHTIFTPHPALCGTKAPEFQDSMVWA